MIVREGKFNGGGRPLDGIFSLDGSTPSSPSNELDALVGFEFYPTVHSGNTRTGYVYYYDNDWFNKPRFNGFMTFASGNGREFQVYSEYHFNIAVEPSLTVLVDGIPSDVLGAYPIDLGDLTHGSSAAVTFTLFSGGPVFVEMKSLNGGLKHESSTEQVPYQVTLDRIVRQSTDITDWSDPVAITPDAVQGVDKPMRIETRSVEGMSLPAGTYTDELSITFSVR